MLDKLSRKILKRMRENPNATKKNFHEGIYSISKSISEDVSLVRPAVKFLKENGFIEYIYSNHGALLGFRLTHMGLHNEEFERLENAEKWKERILGAVGTIIVELLIMGIAYGIKILATVLSQGG